MATPGLRVYDALIQFYSRSVVLDRVLDQLQNLPKDASWVALHGSAAQGALLVSRIGTLESALLRDVPVDALTGFLGDCEIQQFKTRREILQQGEVGSHAYLILSGAIEVNFLDINGNSILAHLARPGEVMGEIEIFSGKTCAATCTAIAGSTLAQFTAATLMKHVGADLLLRNFAAIAHDRLMRDNQQQSLAMFYTAENRIRVCLLSLTSPAQPETRISQAHLATFTGCSRQTVNMTLAQLRDAGLVSIGRGKITVLDRDRLVSSDLEFDKIVRPPQPRSRLASA